MAGGRKDVLDIREIVRRLKWSGPVFWISGLTRQGTQELCQAVMRRLEGRDLETRDARHETPPKPKKASPLRRASQVSRRGKRK